ncbi:phage holin [Candidatus Enterococcus clewellii]|uniref:SPP1 family holin n=1 Tax=Candidatus Enterococcus clewellii TaxID=1834193 RepID=A0A242K241_9ENTE|nr:phage holin [Enterococcus sp. 9E7_DIV0242]OTP12660.1 SPP1 family holin [Enterococcus sp. 9E7_DIV0242]
MKQVSAETIARTIVLMLALINQVLAILGKGTIDIAENDLYQVISLLFTIGSTAVAWWKNNSFTAAAIEADERLKELKEDGE